MSSRRIHGGRFVPDPDPLPRQNIVIPPPPIDIDAVIFDPDPNVQSTNIKSNRSVDQSPIAPGVMGATNLGSDTSGITTGVSGFYSSIVGGDQNEVGGNNSSIIGGFRNKIIGIFNNSIIGGNSNTILGNESIILGGKNNNIQANSASCEGETNTITELAGHAEGIFNSVHATAGHAEGFSNTILHDGLYGHVEGLNNIVSGLAGHAQGNFCTSSGGNSDAGGSNTESRGINSYSKGNSTLALGQTSIAVGNDTVSTGENSYSEGIRTDSLRYGQHSINCDFGDTEFQPRGARQTSILTLFGSTPGLSSNESVDLIFGVHFGINPGSKFNLENGKAYNVKITAIANGITPNPIATRSRLSLILEATVSCESNVAVINNTLPAPVLLKYGDVEATNWDLSINITGDQNIIFKFNTQNTQYKVLIEAKLEFTEIADPIPFDLPPPPVG